MDRREFRTAVLASFGADAAQIRELLAYNENVFDHAGLSPTLRFPLEDEPFVGAWEGYVEEARREGVQRCLERRFVQFSFPIRAGISETDEYRAATRKGMRPREPVAGGLKLRDPEHCRIVLHQTSAGRIPLLIAGDRQDFVSCVQAFSRRNEPVAIPPSMGACTVAGFNNWDRMRKLRAEWEADTADSGSEEAWNAEFQRLVPQKHLYQDRFIVLSEGPYSGVRAEELGLPAEEWGRASLIIRREHECAHYFTRRVFSSMRNNLIDELIADYTGIVAAAGSFRADWFLRFMGLAAFPVYLPGGRLEIYRGTLSDGAFRILQKLLKSAAEHVEAFHAGHAAVLAQPNARALAIIVLTEFTAEELASAEAQRLLEAHLARHLEMTSDALQASAGRRGVS